MPIQLISQFTRYELTNEEYREIAIALSNPLVKAYLQNEQALVAEKIVHLKVATADRELALEYVQEEAHHRGELDNLTTLLAWEAPVRDDVIVPDNQQIQASVVNDNSPI